MSQEQAHSLIQEEMDDVKTVMALKSNAQMNNLKENRRYVQVVF